MKSARINFSALAVATGFLFSINLAYGWGETSQADPMVFWVNNNYDRSKWSADDGTNIDDDVLATSSAACCPNTPNTPTPDYNYRDVFGHRVIPCKRDLLDFTSLWIRGVDAGLRAKLAPNGTIVLNWGDVGSPNSANPTIDLFVAAGLGHQYLTNDAIAAKQIDPIQSPYVGRLGPGQSIQLNANNFGTNWFGDNFIWCGVSNGTGGLNLTFTDGNGNTLATTTVYINVIDIRQMYERWTVGDRPKYPPKAVADCASEDLPPPFIPFRYTPSSDPNTPYILFVHGWNLERWEKDRYAESAFKRLYWQGYQGRFGEFRWPTDYDFGGIGSGAKNTPLNDPQNYDRSESNAWASATGLLNKLNDLNAQYPGHVYLMAHSMGNVVAGEALRQAGASLTVNAYVAMQGAISAHCYDPSTVSRWSIGPPDRYAYYWTSNSPCYFNGVVGAGAFVNFFNVNDYALNLWQTDQDTKPDSGYQYSPSLDQFLRNVGLGSVSLYFPANTYEIFAFADPARSYALGAQLGVGGAFTGSQINLQSIWQSDPLPKQNFSSHFWHSGEFRGDYPPQVNFWQTLLGSQGFGLK